MHCKSFLVLSVMCFMFGVNSVHIRASSDELPTNQENTDITDVCNRFNTQNDVITNMLKSFSTMS